MTTDLLLAIAHHIVMFVLAGLLVTELVFVLRGIDRRGAMLVARLDALFGISAVLILAVGFARVFLGAQPEAYYLENPIFWAKIGALIAVALLSIVPTIRFARWSRSAAKVDAFTPPAEEMVVVRRFVVLEALVFLLIPTFAALMARGYGLG